MGLDLGNLGAFWKQWGKTEENSPSGKHLIYMRKISKKATPIGAAHNLKKRRNLAEVA
jgi:hypothetical protein